MNFSVVGGQVIAKAIAYCDTAAVCENCALLGSRDEHRRSQSLLHRI